MNDTIENSLVQLGNSNISPFNFLSKKKTRWDDSSKYVFLSSSKSKKTRWCPENEKSFTPLPYINIPDKLDVDTFENVVRKHRLEDIIRRLSSNDWENADPDIRSPSPEPVYDSRSGHRLNTREVRTKEKYVKEKNSLIEELIVSDKNFVPPSDYRPPKKIKKLYIPEGNEKHNFTGLIIGPRGITQRELEKKSGCKISVRGKGSNWNSNSWDKTYHDELEPLHVHIQADTEEDLRRGVALIEPIIDPNSEEFLIHKQNQKMAVSTLLGFNQEPACENCGQRGHKSWACPESIGNFTKTEVQCDICGDKSHPTCDCPERKELINSDKTEMENDFVQFLREMDEFNAKASIPVLEPEIKPSDIRRSVLMTGKIPEKIETETEKVNEECEGIKVDEVKEEPKIIDTNQVQEEKKNETQPEETIVEKEMIENKQELPEDINPPTVDNTDTYLQNQIPIMTNPNMSTIPNSNNTQPYGKLDYKVPLIPIAQNPNVIKSAPVNYNYTNQIQINPNGYMPPGGYYNTQMNPFMYQSPNVGMNVRPHVMNVNRGLFSSNFQGKIPMNYGINIKGVGYQQLNALNAMNNPRNYFYPNLSYNIRGVGNHMAKCMNMHHYINNNLYMSGGFPPTYNIEKQTPFQPPEPESPIETPPEPENEPVEQKPNIEEQQEGEEDDITVEKV